MYDFDKEKDSEFLREAGKLLQERVLNLEKELVLARLKNEKDEEIKQKLTEELLNRRKRIFDSKQERKEIKPPKNKKRKKGNLPHNQSQNTSLEDAEIILDEEICPYIIEDNCCPKCGGHNLNEMNNCFEESSEIDVNERKYIHRRHQRQKYSCKDCHNVVTAPGGVKLTPGGEYSIQMATQIAGDKFEDHIPLERQRKQMQRVGLNVEAKTLFGLTEHLYRRLYTLSELIRKDVLSEKWIHIDESPIDFYNPNKSKGYIWSMSNPRGAYYQFEPTRSGAVAREMLRGYENGCVVTDGFSGYNFLNNQETIKHAFCWAHVRRKFFEAMNHDPKAEAVVDLIDELYEIEHQATNLEELRIIRRERSSLVVERIDSWIDSMEGRYLQSTSLGKAIGYYVERKNGLHLFINNEIVPIDNNMAERRQRCPVMGRKNFLHFKSINGADVGAFFYSVIESCKSNGLNARAYINEMAHRSANDEVLESPFNYASRLNSEISSQLSQELSELLKKSESS